MEKLAMHGGAPASKRMLGYGRQTIDEDDVAAVTEVLRSNFLTCGPAIERFEKAVAEAAGARYVTAVANGTAPPCGNGPATRSPPDHVRRVGQLRALLRWYPCFR